MRKMIKNAKTQKKYLSLGYFSVMLILWTFVLVVSEITSIKKKKDCFDFFVCGRWWGYHPPLSNIWNQNNFWALGQRPPWWMCRPCECQRKHLLLSQEMRPGYCHREAAVGFALYCYGPKTSCNIPPAKNLRTEPRSWKRWCVLAHWSGAAKTICGTICSVGVDKSSGWDLADAKMPTVWTRTKQSRARWGARTSSMPCDGRPQEIWLDCFPSKAQDGNLTTDARMSLFPFVFLFLSSSAASQVFSEILCASLSHLLEK